MRAARARHRAAARHRSSGLIALAGVTALVTASLMTNGPAAVGQVGVVGSTPVGSVIAYAGVTTPAGWLSADGQAVSRTQYAELFSVIGTTYGAGNGTTTFNLPDLRGRVPVGADGLAGRLSANDLLGQAGGEERHQLTLAELPAHSHADGTLSATTAGDHAHNDGTLTTSTAGSHTHSDAGHAHGPGGQYFLNYAAFATGWGFADGGHQVQASTATATGHANLSTAGAHAHDVTGSTGNAGSHTHDVTGSTATVGGGNAHNVLQPYQVVNWIIRAQSSP